MSGWVQLAIWVTGYIITVRSALLWTARRYARDGLSWDSSLTWGHLALYATAGAVVWPAWWIGVVGYLTLRRFTRVHEWLTAVHDREAAT